MRTPLLTPILLGILALTAQAAAAYEDAPASPPKPERPCEVFRIGKARMGFVSDLETRILISEACQKSGGELDCDAYRAVSRATLAGTDAGTKGGKNPGFLLCGKLGGRAVTGFDADRNQASFCRFPDESMIETGALYFHARENDSKKER